MNLNKLQKKNLIRICIISLPVLFLAASVSSFGPVLTDILKNPFTLLTAMQREAGAIIFFQRNSTQNERLTKEVDFLKSKLVSQQELYLENDRLRKLLSFKQREQFKVIPAKVIARSPDSWSSSIIIDRGRNSGIKTGMVVINFLGLIGKVIDTQEYTSKVLLVTDPGFAVSALIQRSREEGLICGTLGSNLIMRYLPEDPDIKLQDEVVTSGLSHSTPKGLLIGSIIGLGREFSGLSRYCLVKPAVDLSNIEEVLIIVS